MKKTTVTTVLVYAFFALAACASGGKTAGKTVPLDQAIRAAAENLENTLAQGTIAAVLYFSSPSEAFSAYVLDELSDRLVNGGNITVVDRAQLDFIRTEEQFQLSGEVSDESAQAIGKKLGAQIIISGSLAGIGQTYRVRIRALAVETAVIASSRSDDIDPKEGRVRDLLGGRAPASEPAAPAIQPAPPQTEKTGPAMVRVEGGTFQMGSSSGENDERPVHQVTVSSFFMGKYEVTQKEWTAVTGGNPSSIKGDNLPVVQVSWYDAVEFCNKLSEKEGLTPAYTIDKNIRDWNNESEYDDMKWTVRWNRNAGGYRLPTEAEWEYAARGGNGSPGNYTYAGSNNMGEVAWYGENSAGSVQEAGALKPNGLGLYDMSGNVWEWCWDWYGDYPSGAQTDPVGAASGSRRVMRGGNWFNYGQDLRSAARGSSTPYYRYTDNGFRLLRP